MTELTCQGCKVGLFAMKKIFENKFVRDIMMTFLSESICPLIAMNTTVCDGGSRNMGGPLLDAFT
jgi:sphingomyelin phosphodiesterase